MVTMGQLVDYRQLRAPRADGGVLIEPPPSAAAEVLARNVTILSEANFDVQGRRLSTLARQAHEELVRAALDYTRQYRDVTLPAVDGSGPILLAGHQPQLFHAGVWYKNFVLSALAQRHGATAVNLVIDSDTIKSAALRVPGGSPFAPRVEVVPFDLASPEIPYEERTVLDQDCLCMFGKRAEAVLSGLVPEPLLGEFWPLVTERAKSGARLGETLSQARHLQEERWGAQTLELPQSRICCLESFRWFTAHLLAQLPRVREEYNAAVREYRRVNHLRSMAHPVPELAADDGWLEAPYWIWTRDNPRRRRLFVRSEGRELVLTDRDALRLRLDLAADGDPTRAVQQMADLARAGIKLRTRALITTLFARVVLGDLFLHGLGGAKYDQVTDQLIAKLFGLEPPTYLTVTATLRLPIAREDVTIDDQRLVDSRLRELEFHPERYVDAEDDPRVRELKETKQRWIDTPQTISNARERCQSIRGVNAALQPWLTPLRSQLLGEREGLLDSLRGEAILNSRDYAFCLFPSAKLRQLMQTASDGC